MATEKLSAAVQALTQRVLDLPFNQSQGLELVHQEAGAAVATFEARDNLMQPLDALHVGILHAVMESVCLLAVAPQLQPGERAVTHDFHASVMRPILASQRVELRAQVQRQGRNLVFVDGEAWAGDKLCYLARVTKSIVRDEPPPAAAG
jgi:uncharacterized protein (TIGR00369 family)